MTWLYEHGSGWREKPRGRKKNKHAHSYVLVGWMDGWIGIRLVFAVRNYPTFGPAPTATANQTNQSTNRPQPITYLEYLLYMSLSLFVFFLLISFFLSFFPCLYGNTQRMGRAEDGVGWTRKRSVSMAGMGRLNEVRRRRPGEADCCSLYICMCATYSRRGWESTYVHTQSIWRIPTLDICVWRRTLFVVERGSGGIELHTYIYSCMTMMRPRTYVCIEQTCFLR